MKSKKTVSKKTLTSLEKVHLKNNIIYYLEWVDGNGDLVDEYVLDVNLDKSQDVINEPKPEPKKRKLSIKKTLLKFRESISPKSRTFRLTRNFLVIVLLVTFFQLVYPTGRSLPFAKLDSYGLIGFANDQKVLSALSDFDNRIVTVHTQSKNITTSYKDLGVTIDPNLTAEKITDYPIEKRLIPFSFLFYGNKQYSINRNINDSQLRLFVENVVAMASKKPVDAQVTIENGQISVSESEEGYEYKIESLKSTVLNADLGDNSQLVFTPTILYPNISSEIAETNAKRMQKRINNPLTISADGKFVTFDSKELAGWIEIVHRPDQKTVDIIFNEQRIAQSLATFPQMVDYPAKPAVTTMLNGSRVGRTEGSSGRSLQFDDLVKKIADTTSPATGSVEASVLTLIPEELIDRKYTKDSAGMQSLFDYWTTTNDGNYYIDFRTLNGRISANINSNQLLPAVGIHKTYIASLIYNRLAAGSISFNTITQTGETVDSCLNKMVIFSDELCTNALGSIVGWSASDQLLKNQGFESTTLTPGASLSTPNDATDWLIKLSAGNITTVGHAYLLAELMANQSIRSGIPAGSLGYRVENKSGAYGRNINDIGVVYHPGGAYALSVMSEGGSYSAIANLASEINKVIAQ